jgi:nucleoside-diphosphate-sugar epimerase
MARLLVTGASGYIGKRFVAMARSDGHTVVAPGRTAAPDAEFFPWSLGEDMPSAALTGVDAVIHLAHSWRADASGASHLNAEAGERLAREALAANVPRFVFASSTSARPTALNAYGRVKHAMETGFAALPQAAGRIVSARIALVYGGEPAGQYATMRKLTALTPILPMVGIDRMVQPIHLDEVCRALLVLALSPALKEPVYVIAGAPMRFGQWLKLLRKVQTGRGLMLIPVPLGLLLWMSKLTHLVPRERLLGLASTSPMAAAESLAALGIEPGDPQTLLQREVKEWRLR